MHVFKSGTNQFLSGRVYSGRFFLGRFFSVPGFSSKINLDPKNTSVSGRVFWVGSESVFRVHVKMLRPNFNNRF